MDDRSDAERKSVCVGTIALYVAVFHIHKSMLDSFGYAVMLCT